MSLAIIDENDPLAKERDVKFKKWLQNKAIKEKAFEVGVRLFKLVINYLKIINFSRCSHSI